MTEELMTATDMAGDFVLVLTLHGAAPERFPIARGVGLRARAQLVGKGRKLAAAAVSTGFIEVHDLSKADEPHRLIMAPSIKSLDTVRDRD